MNKDSLWFGFLEAGEKGSPVVLDPKLSTGKAETVYLFNLKRNEVIEYKREIAEPKLRELNGNEQDIVKELKSAYKKAKKEFTPRGGKALNIAETAAEKPKKAEASSIDVDLDIAIEDEEVLLEEEDD